MLLAAVTAEKAAATATGGGATGGGATGAGSTGNAGRWFTTELTAACGSGVAGEAATGVPGREATGAAGCRVISCGSLLLPRIVSEMTCDKINKRS
jgi:hypothetical protein